MHIDGAELVPKGDILSGAGLAKIPQDRPTVLYCKTGIRSAEALARSNGPVSPMPRTCRAV